MTELREVRGVEVYAGAGGWSQGFRLLGFHSLPGVELDPDACATARAAGHRRIERDATTVVLRRGEGAGGGLVASPPCPGFSNGGKHAGRRDLATLLAWLPRWLAGEQCAARPDVEDPRSLLLLEVARWIYALQPSWIALEQVPAVLPFWRALGALLEGDGYSVWIGGLDAADYGVPQTRRRAFLLARRGEPVQPPLPEFGRQPVPMCWALPEWSHTDLVGFPRRNDRDDGHEYRVRDLRAASGPAFTLTEKARSWSRIAADGTRHRVTLEEASVLAGFPADYPWKGSRTSCFLQLANAVAPPVAAAVLREVIV